MSLTEFLVRLGLYDEEFTRTPAYDGLLIELPSGESQEIARAVLAQLRGMIHTALRPLASGLLSSCTFTISSITH